MDPSLLESLRALTAQPVALEKLKSVVSEHHVSRPLVAADLLELTESIAISGVHPRLLLYHLRSACGLEPVPGSDRVVEWLREYPGEIGQVMGFDLRTCRLVYSDWSVTAPEFIPPQQYDDPHGFTERIWKGIRASGAVAAIGGYNHIRPAYGGGLFAADGGARTLHLGLDVFAEPGSPVFAPLDGVVHSVADNAAPFDYGPCLVLEHRPRAEMPCFYTLYGHLAAEVLELQPGQPIRKGTQVAQLGNFPENGNWPPHLHVQLVLDMLDKRGDFWGSCHPAHFEVWLSLCPDANLTAQVPVHLFPVVPPEQRCCPESAGRAVARGPDGTVFDACGQRLERSQR
ncbi:MAG: peptidoglycan DD-metalloendopeptidase family protein [Meiothermus sp.]|nr:peptidoglycan DD-metalloendopeptidase family protein [Meiothermus sp.]